MHSLYLIFLIVGGLYSVTALQENDQERSRGEAPAASQEEEETLGGAKGASVFRIVLGGGRDVCLQVPFLILRNLHACTRPEEREWSRGEAPAASREEEETLGGAKRASPFRIVLGNRRSRHGSLRAPTVISTFPRSLHAFE